jgi:16S rRNA (cytosine967-C5)-methyltransferase
VNAREVARAVLRRVEQGDAWAALALQTALEAHALSPADRGLATEIVYGVLRHQLRLDRALNAHATHGIKKQPAPVLIALRAAAYQILFLRVPSHAAVDDAVAAVKGTAGPKVAGFANAVLRALAEKGEPPPPPATDVPATLEAVHSIPRWLGERMARAVGPAEVIAFAEATNRPPPVSLRVSLSRISRDEALARLRLERPDADVQASAHAPEAILVHHGGSPESLELFQEGLVTVQDVAAQMAGRLCGAADGERLLDACAGVGGKSTHLLQLARCRVDAVDVSRRKLDLAEDTARRLHVEGLTAIVDDLTRPAALAAAYDRVLLDAPCSGLGVLRRHPEGKWRRRPAEIPKLAALQAEILDALAPRVRPGGVLVYSVCTFTEEEGEGQIDRFLREHADFRRDATLRTFPHREDADAFFAVRLLRGA